VAVDVEVNVMLVLCLSFQVNRHAFANRNLQVMSTS